uniref:DUF4861 domain-containing protein n=1 Tax=uncultured bacterium contig00074 TaxID=1181553 RepID=A0A806KNA2_9BACT|nr:hypothetical protein [uncultured bacterium contig00074]
MTNLRSAKKNIAVAFAGVAGVVFLASLPSQMACKKSQTITIVNPDASSRSEIVEIPLGDVGEISHVLGKDGKPAIHQVLDIDGSRTLLLLADVPPGGTAKYSLVLGESAKADAAADQIQCYGRYVPERKDDYAWDNDRVAFRIYGPALAATPGEITGSGVDAWSKKVPYSIIDKWYAKWQAGEDYHTDHGEGMDAYNVGASRGCGGTGVFSGGKIYASGVWKSQRTLATGPLRVVFEVEYAPYKYGNVTVTETKRVSLDRGSFFNRFQTTLQIEGADTVPFIVGVVRQPNSEDPIQGQGWVALMEPEAAHGRVGTAAILKDGQVIIAENHALLLKQAKNGDTIEHLAGTCWTGEGSFPDLKTWAEYTRTIAETDKQPLTVTLSK